MDVDVVDRRARTTTAACTATPSPRRSMSTPAPCSRSSRPAARRTSASWTTSPRSPPRRSDRDVWLHIDGAYGLAAMLVERMRPAFAGVGDRRLAHRRPAQVALRPVRRVRADLPRPFGGARSRTPRRPSTSTPSPSPRTGTRPTSAIQLTRRARGLPLWFSLATHGTDHYRAAIDHGITPRAADRRRDHRARRAVAGARSAAVGGRVPARGLDAGRLPGVVRSAARGPDRLRRPQLAPRARPCCASRSSARSRRSRPLTGILDTLG